jgi:hypothetical protein
LHVSCTYDTVASATRSKHHRYSAALDDHNLITLLGLWVSSTTVAAIRVEPSPCFHFQLLYITYYGIKLWILLNNISNIY